MALPHYIANWSGGYVDVFAAVGPTHGGGEERYVESDTAEDPVVRFAPPLRVKNLKIKVGSNY
jgi:hypothetical protein